MIILLCSVRVFKRNIAIEGLYLRLIIQVTINVNAS